MASLRLIVTLRPNPRQHLNSIMVHMYHSTADGEGVRE